MINLLPEIVINKLKAWEIVERPASVVKELIENALDANATHISIDIHDGWKSLILIQDDGDGISIRDTDLLLQRHATSKISNDEDLSTLWSYGFRGEALASISEVSSLTIESIVDWHRVWFRTEKNFETTQTHHVSLPFKHGTKVMVEHLFQNTPVRQKFLKSNQTEYYYCYQVLIDFAIVRSDISWTIAKNWKTIHNLPVTNDIATRLLQIYKRDRNTKLLPISHTQANVSLQWIIWHSSLTFWSREYCKIYVNGRPIQDRALQKAIMEGYRRQIAHREYPLAILVIDLPSDLVDVNVHPRKTQIKFADPGALFTIVRDTIQTTLWENKISQESHKFNLQPIEETNNTFLQQSRQKNHNTKSSASSLFSWEHEVYIKEEYHDASLQHNWQTNYKVVGQIRDSYIIVQHPDGLWYVDQHALAERIAFEKLRARIDNKEYTSTTLLTPLSVEFSQTQDADTIVNQLQELWFDTTLRWANRLIIYKVPQYLVDYTIDIDKIIRHLLTSDDREVLPEAGDESGIWLMKLLDAIFATRACKISIKANHRLSLLEMQQLIRDGFDKIPGWFVCQHGRPFVFNIDKSQIDHMFDR